MTLPALATSACATRLMSSSLSKNWASRNRVGRALLSAAAAWVQSRVAHATLDSLPRLSGRIGGRAAGSTVRMPSHW